MTCAKSFPGAVVCCSVLAIFALAAPAQPMPLGTAFTFQGLLTDGGIAASGTYDFELKLFDSAAGGNQIGSALFLDDVTVTNGLFTVTLDFGASAFAGSARWIEIGVRPGASSGAYTTLSGRQELTPVPNALYSQAVPWSGVAGKPAGFADGVDHDALGSLSCAAGDLARWNGSAWSCASAGTYQVRITGTCPSGSAVRQVNADGTVVCEATIMHTSAACCSSTDPLRTCQSCGGVCGAGKVVADVGGNCSVTSDTGSCNNVAVFGRCCVCRP